MVVKPAGLDARVPLTNKGSRFWHAESMNDFIMRANAASQSASSLNFPDVEYTRGTFVSYFFFASAPPQSMHRIGTVLVSLSLPHS